MEVGSTNRTIDRSIRRRVRRGQKEWRRMGRDKRAERRRTVLADQKSQDEGEAWMMHGDGALTRESQDCMRLQATACDCSGQPLWAKV